MAELPTVLEFGGGEQFDGLAQPVDPDLGRRGGSERLADLAHPGDQLGELNGARLLTAHLQRAAQGVRGLGQSGGGVAPVHKHGGQHVTLRRHRFGRECIVTGHHHHAYAQVVEFLDQGFGIRARSILQPEQTNQLEGSGIGADCDCQDAIPGCSKFCNICVDILFPCERGDRLWSAFQNSQVVSLRLRDECL